MPADHGIRPDDHHRVETARPEAVEQDPEGSVEPGLSDPGSPIVSKNLQLVTKRDHLKLQIGASSEARKETVKDGEQDLVHGPDATEHRTERPGIPRRMEFMEGTGHGAHF